VVSEAGRDSRKEASDGTPGEPSRCKRPARVSHRAAPVLDLRGAAVGDLVVCAHGGNAGWPDPVPGAGAPV